MKILDLLDIDEYIELFDLPNNEIRETEYIHDLVYQAVQLIQRPEKLVGINSGLTELDELTNGWKNGDLIYIGISPEFDKSGFSKTLLLNPVIKDKKSIAYFSNTPDVKQLVGTLCSAYMGLFNASFKEGVDTLSKLPIHLECVNEISIDELNHKIYLLKEEYGVDMIIIEDFDSIIHIEKGITKSQSEKQTLKSLKEIAYFFKIPIIILSQLPIERDKPNLGSLKINVHVEDFADVLLLLRKGADNYGKMKMELCMCKNKNNELKDIYINYNNSFNCFSDDIIVKSNLYDKKKIYSGKKATTSRFS